MVKYKRQCGANGRCGIAQNNGKQHSTPESIWRVFLGCKSSLKIFLFYCNRNAKRVQTMLKLASELFFGAVFGNIQITCGHFSYTSYSPQVHTHVQWVFQGVVWQL